MASGAVALASRRIAHATGLVRAAGASPSLTWQRSMSMLSGDGRVLEEQEHARENVYFQKLEHEKLEKLKEQLEAHKEEAAAHAASAHAALKAAQEAQRAAESAKPAGGGSGSIISFAAGCLVAGLAVWALK
eukprot:TRINITY_DN4433_c0_g1_i1.p3 TRINITY_DN4433_c0_g1~~TRINITY_DN4433_c0_g1_i1.p3  ORF type:complete len:132 (-),score=4.79 TRINITY_DN4433_c0_g1_i1:167-562(-)